MKSNKVEVHNNAHIRPDLVDRLAFVKAQIASLLEQESALKQAMVDTGLAVLEGTAHRCTVSVIDGRVTTDWRSVAERLSPSRQLIAAHTTQGEAFTQVRCVARKTSN
jgi:hypothetical protein